jgi:hypothetical protein
LAPWLTGCMRLQNRRDGSGGGGSAEIERERRLPNGDTTSTRNASVTSMVVILNITFLFQYSHLLSFQISNFKFTLRWDLIVLNCKLTPK